MKNNLYIRVLNIRIGEKIELEDDYILECIDVESYKVYNDIECYTFDYLIDLLDFLKIELYI